MSRSRAFTWATPVTWASEPSPPASAHSATPPASAKRVRTHRARPERDAQQEQRAHEAAVYESKKVVQQAPEAERVADARARASRL